MTRGRALVTGVSGQDGSLLADRLLDEGWDVHGLVRTAGAADQARRPEVEVHVADLGRRGSLDPIVERVDPDVVFNLAGITSVAQSWDDPVATSTVTGLAVVDALEACRRLGERRGRPVRFVQASSAEIFGDAAITPQDETTPLAPVNPYGAAKAFAHTMTGLYRRRGLPASTAILYNHESPLRPLSFVTRKITRGVAEIALGRRDELTLGNLDARRDWSWAADVVDALLRIAAAPEPGDWVVASGVTHSVREFAELAFRAAGIDHGERYLRVDPRFVRPADAGEQRGDASRLREELGWQPTLGLAGIVSEMVAHDLAELRRDE